MTARKILPALLICSMSLQGCATNEDGSRPNIFSDLSLLGGGRSASLTPAQRELRSRDRDYAKARVTGAAIGALAGGLACALSNCSAEETAAAMGAGGVAGYVGASYLVRDNRNFAASQDTLQADIRLAGEETRALERDAQVAQTVLDVQRRRTTELRNAYRANEAELDALRLQAESLEGDIEATRELRLDAERRVAGLELTIGSYDRQGFHSGPLRSEVAKQKSFIGRMRRIETAMVGVLDGLPSEAR